MEVLHVLDQIVCSSCLRVCAASGLAFGGLVIVIVTGMLSPPLPPHTFRHPPPRLHLHVFSGWYSLAFVVIVVGFRYQYHATLAPPPLLYGVRNPISDVIIARLYGVWNPMIPMVLSSPSPYTTTTTTRLPGLGVWHPACGVVIRNFRDVVIHSLKDIVEKKA